MSATIPNTDSVPDVPARDGSTTSSKLNTMSNAT